MIAILFSNFHQTRFNKVKWENTIFTAQIKKINLFFTLNGTPQWVRQALLISFAPRQPDSHARLPAYTSISTEHWSKNFACFLLAWQSILSKVRGAKVAQACAAARSVVCYLLAPELGALKTKVNVGRSSVARTLPCHATQRPFSLPLFASALPFSSFVRQTQLLRLRGCLP